MATVLNTPAKSFYNNVEWVRRAPQVHLHYLTDNRNKDPLRKAEMCCHGCGTAVLLTYSSVNMAALESTKDRFVNVHKQCPNHHYNKRCVDIRLSMELRDIRNSHKPDPPKELIR
jgi:hypothetical protein